MIITIKSKNKKEFTKIKTLLKVIEVDYQTNESDRKPSKKFLDTLKEAREDYANGNVIKINPDNIWESIL